MGLPLWIGLAGLLFGGARSEVKRFEHLAARDIRSKLERGKGDVSVSPEWNGLIGGAFGDMKAVTIRAKNFSTQGLPLFTEPDFGKRGRIGTLRLDLANFSLRGLQVDRLFAEIPNCRFDYDLALRKKQIRLSQSGVGQGMVEVNEMALQAFVLKRFREIKSVKIGLRNNYVFVEGYGEFLVIATQFKVIAKLVVEEGVRIRLDHAYVWFDGVSADPAAEQAILEVLNPIIDLNRDLGLYNAIRISELELHNGRLFARGAAQIPANPNTPRTLSRP